MSEGGIDVPNKVGEYLRVPDTADIRQIQIERELKSIEAHYAAKELPPLDPLGKYELQTNPGVNKSFTGGTCTLASAGNALRSLGVYDPTKHTEEKLIDFLGGDEFIKRTNGGASHEDIASALIKLVPGAKVRGSISAYEILYAVEHGAAAVVNVGAAHAGAIYPGSRVTRDEGKLQVQVIDPVLGVKMMSIHDFVRYQLPIFYPPSWNNATIIEKVKRSKLI